MIQKLKFSVTFTTGRKLEGEHDFQKGMSAITGPNESGKSFRLEMIRFALFGTKALRASMSTISKLSVALTFTVNDNTYTVSRSKSSATLWQAEQPIATGTSPVNAEIVRLFGYNLDVFDTTNACLQGQVEALSEKKPTERRRMVDKVIGLEVIDTIISEVTEKLTVTRQTLVSLEKMVNHALVAPEKPIQLTMNSIEYQEEIAKCEEIYRERYVIDGRIKALKCEPKELPVKPDGDKEQLRTQIFEVKKRIEDLINISNNKKGLETKIKAIPEKDVSLLQSYIFNDGYQQWVKYNAYLSSVVEDPDCSLDNVKYLRSYFAQEEIKAKIFKLEQGETITCPNCFNHFHLNQTDINELTSKLNTQIDWNFWGKLALKLNLKSANQLDALEAKIEKYQAFMALPVISKPDLPNLGLPETVELQIAKQQERIKLLNELKGLEEKDVDTELVTLKNERDKSIKQLNLLIAYEEDLAEVKLNNDKYLEYCNYKNSVATKLQELDEVYLQLKTLQQLKSDAIAYESLVGLYKVQQEQNDKLSVEIEQLNQTIEEYTKLRKALQELKPRVKQYLVPSLNRVASNLLSQMTSGVRRKVLIDEEFNILIDDQPIDTLSGSGKAVSNLAIRIGLGTVLTNKVFSVFLADEIDASMDKDRVAYTAECLKNLTKNIDQIILVSHKKPDADHQIEL